MISLAGERGSIDYSCLVQAEVCVRMCALVRSRAADLCSFGCGDCGCRVVMMVWDLHGGSGGIVNVRVWWRAETSADMADGKKCRRLDSLAVNACRVSQETALS